MTEDEASRRQQEINMFAALANEDFNSGTFDFASQGKPKEEKVEPPQVDCNDPMQNLFAQAARQIDDSGTFNFATTSNPRAAVGRSNLEAAAAALTDEPKDFSQTQKVADPIPVHRPMVAPKSKYTSAMHMEQVFLPRPLFFGPILPPRVIREARKIVAAELKEQGYDGNGHPRISRCRPEVRNLIAALRTYGHGIDVVTPDDNNADEACRGSSYVSIFSPVWGEPSISKVVDPDAPDPDALAPDTPYPDVDASANSQAPTNLEAAASDHKSSPESTPNQRDPSTPVGQAVSDEKGTGETMASERDLFSMWARGESDDNASLGEQSAKSSESLESFRMAPKKGPSVSSSSLRTSSDAEGKTPVPMSDQDLFSHWARGESPANSNRDIGSAFGNSIVFGQDSQGTAIKSGTFLQMPSLAPQDAESDDDSVVGSELKKKVGINEHLNAALASLEEEWTGPTSSGGSQPMNLSDDPMLTQVPLTKDGGRALTNLELVNGCTPLFGVDDAPLPVEADLGIHETKDEQQRSREQRRNQNIIENFCPQNIFGPVACPSPSLEPDDNHTWNSRSNSSQRLPLPPGLGTIAAKNVALPKLDGASRMERQVSGELSVHTAASQKGKAGSVSGRSKPKPLPASFQPSGRFDSRTRFGWWNVPEETANEKPGSDEEDIVEKADEEIPLQLPPAEHSASALLVQTRLEPSPEKLREQNRPLSQLHTATPFAASLPFLSDRPPSYRYLQVDTQAVGFPALGGEVEPLFCSLAIYNVETISPGGNDPNMAPIPDLQRCGRITETLNFDVVSDPGVESRCFASLWPHAPSMPALGKSALPFKRISLDKQNPNALSSLGDNEKLQSTRCGVFPLPSNLNISNLYVILTVQKVISEGSDFEVYLRPSKQSGQEKIDLENLRARAEKASRRQGRFLMPFSFGVAPLLQVFGADVPLVASSRAVQIPLFRFSAGLGERQIIDHIMVMLYPR